MASIYKRKNANGTTVWRAVIRLKGHPTVCIHRDRKEEAKDDASEIERQIKAGQFKFDQHKKLYTFNELIDRYILDGALEHHRSADDTKRHLAYWKSRLGAAARNLLNRCWFDEEKCSRGIHALENYRKEWNDRQGCWASHPLHNFASHGSDAFRILVTGIGLLSNKGLTAEEWKILRAKYI